MPSEVKLPEVGDIIRGTPEWCAFVRAATKDYLGMFSALHRLIDNQEGCDAAMLLAWTMFMVAYDSGVEDTKKKATHAVSKILFG